MEAKGLKLHEERTQIEQGVNLLGTESQKPKETNGATANTYTIHDKKS